MDPASKPILTVVIPTMGRPVVVKTLESLSSCEKFDQVEVFLVGEIREEATAASVAALCKKFPSIIHKSVSFPVGDSSEKKNVGARLASSDIVAFIDDDVKLASNWPETMLAPFAEPSVALVSGPSLVPDDVNLFARLAGLALSSPAAGYVAFRYRSEDPTPMPINWSRIIGCNMAYRKTAWEQLGGFDPAFWPGEEMILAFKAEQTGLKLMFNPQAYVYHFPRQSLPRFWRQIFGYGATRIRLIRGKVQVEPTTLVPALWVLSLLVLGAGTFLHSWFAILFALDVAAYLLVDVWITLRMVGETRRNRDLLVFLLIPLMHLSYGLGEWVELFRPDKDLSERHHR